MNPMKAIKKLSGVFKEEKLKKLL